MIGLRQRLRLPRARSRGRILAVKWGLNPNSSSLGVDVTFFLFGATALAMTTPFLAALIRWKKPVTDTTGNPVVDIRPAVESEQSHHSGQSHDPTPPA